MGGGLVGRGLWGGGFVDPSTTPALRGPGRGTDEGAVGGHRTCGHRAHEQQRNDTHWAGGRRDSEKNLRGRPTVLRQEQKQIFFLEMPLKHFWDPIFVLPRTRLPRPWLG